MVRGHTFSFASSVMAAEPGSVGVALPDIEVGAGVLALATAVADTRVAGSKRGGVNL